MVAMGNTWRMAASYGTTTVCLKPVRPALCTKWSPCMPCGQLACFAGGFASAEPCCLPSCSASHAASINICRLNLLCCMQHCWLSLLQAGVCGLCRLSLVLHPGKSAILRWIKGERAFAQSPLPHAQLALRSQNLESGCDEGAHMHMSLTCMPYRPCAASSLLKLL